MTDPSVPATPAPSLALLNAGSLVKMGAGLLAGWIAAHSRMSPDDARTVVAAAISVILVVAHLLKNGKVVTDWIRAATSPPVAVARAGKIIIPPSAAVMLALAVMLTSGPLLGGCASLSPQSAAMTAEKADTEAANLYVALAQGIAAYEAMPGRTAAQVTLAEQIKAGAWADLVRVHAAYRAGQAVVLAALIVDQAAFAALK